ncbi:MAG: transcription elongation factor GreA, partial [Armatimonadota bacterium]|nr:transcription elongation factor GreA [Armatimonadota bacterium]
MEEIFLTPVGFRKLEEELEYLKTVRRREVAERIRQAK